MSTRILLLTQENCAACDQTREILQRLAREYPVDLETLDFNSPEGQTHAMRGGMMFPPGVVIDGQPFSYGRPSETKLRRRLEARQIP